MASRRYNMSMSNDLLLVSLAVGVVIALMLGRFAILEAPGRAILQRIRRVVHEVGR